jgi:hypothetical protein
MSRASLKVDRAPKVSLALSLNLRKRVSGTVVELGAAEEDAGEIHGGPGKPAILGDIHHDGDILAMPGDDLGPLVRDRPDHFTETLLGVLNLPVIWSW